MEPPVYLISQVQAREWCE